MSRNSELKSYSLQSAAVKHATVPLPTNRATSVLLRRNWRVGLFSGTRPGARRDSVRT
jgi:hypothetical protein